MLVSHGKVIHKHGNVKNIRENLGKYKYETDSLLPVWFSAELR